MELDRNLKARLKRMIDYKDVAQALNENDDHDFIKDNSMSIAKLLRTCRNELCIKCEKYKNAHLGACNGCMWKDEE